MPGKSSTEQMTALYGRLSRDGTMILHEKSWRCGMCTDTKKGDLRSAKTKKTLNDAMFSLIRHKKFADLKVTDICKEALMSRATFYTHYTDKYDLLKNWLMCLRPESINRASTYAQLEKAVNEFVYNNTTVISNIINNADGETLDILFESVLSF